MKNLLNFNFTSKEIDGCKVRTKRLKNAKSRKDKLDDADRLTMQRTQEFGKHLTVPESTGFGSYDSLPYP